MVAKKRRKKRSHRASGNQGGLFDRIGRLIRRGTFILLLFFLTVCGLYYLGPQIAQEKIEKYSAQLINHLRQQEWMPKPLVGVLDHAYNAVSTSQGLLVDAGELGYDGGPLLAGLPESKRPTHVLRNHAVVNLFDEANRQTCCLAVRLSAPNKALQTEKAIIERLTTDPRVPNLRTGQMTDGPFNAQTLLPPEWLFRSIEETSMQDLRFPTFSVPMRERFYRDSWTLLMEELASEYPSRFGEVWLYVGPVLNPKGKQLASGISIPEQFYAIVFNITAEGWLRAIAFLLPHDPPPESLEQCITSIEAIESLTGLQFLPALNQAAYDSLREWVSPKLW